jgi:hypothetical protein
MFDFSQQPERFLEPAWTVVCQLPGVLMTDTAAGAWRYFLVFPRTEDINIWTHISTPGALLV